MFTVTCSCTVSVNICFVVLGKIAVVKILLIIDGSVCRNGIYCKPLGTCGISELFIRFRRILSHKVTVCIYEIGRTVIVCDGVVFIYYYIRIVISRGIYIVFIHGFIKVGVYSPYNFFIIVFGIFLFVLFISFFIVCN